MPNYHSANQFPKQLMKVYLKQSTNKIKKQCIKVMHCFFDFETHIHYACENYYQVLLRFSRQGVPQLQSSPWGETPKLEKKIEPLKIEKQILD